MRAPDPLLGYSDTGWWRGGSRWIFRWSHQWPVNCCGLHCSAVTWALEGPTWSCTMLQGATFPSCWVCSDMCANLPKVKTIFFTAQLWHACTQHHRATAFSFQEIAIMRRQHNRCSPTYRRQSPVDLDGRMSACVETCLKRWRQQCAAPRLMF